MLGRSVTFGPKSVEKRPQQENFFELTTPNTEGFDGSISMHKEQNFALIIKISTFTTFQ